VVDLGGAGGGEDLGERGVGRGDIS